MVRGGTIESRFPPLRNLSQFIWKSATHKNCLAVTIVYFAFLMALFYLPSAETPKDPKSDQHKKQTLQELVLFAGVGLASLQVFLVLLITLTAAILSSFTISVAAYLLCSWEDLYFEGSEAAYPFRALSLNLLPLAWWAWFEGSEKLFMIASIMAHSYKTLSTPDAPFVDYSLYAPLSGKDKSFRFFISFAIITFVLGSVKVIIMSYVSKPNQSPTKPSGKMEKPKGLSRSKDISEETWMASSPAKKPGLAKRSKAGKK